MHSTTPNKLAKNATDLLEVYCSQESSLTKTARQLGMSANRHGLSDGDLATCEGRCKLYDRMLELLPRNIWLSPKCRAWCRWNTYNMSKSPEMAQRILQARENDVVHLLLCDALFQFQTWRSKNSHAHLEQPVGSHMMVPRGACRNSPANMASSMRYVHCRPTETSDLS